MGYTGGTLENPTYRRLGDHTEAIQLDFDPARVSYGDLLRIFWASIDADSPPYKRQYMSAIWPSDEAQLELARESLERETTARRHPLFVEIAPLGTFTAAEDYHQKYYLRHDRTLMRAFDGYSDVAFRESRVAARLNGFVSRAGTAELFEAERASYGLSPEAEAALRRHLDTPRRRLP